MLSPQLFLACKLWSQIQTRSPSPKYPPKKISHLSTNLSQAPHHNPLPTILAKNVKFSMVWVFRTKVNLVPAFYFSSFGDSVRYTGSSINNSTFWLLCWERNTYKMLAGRKLILWKLQQFIHHHQQIIKERARKACEYNKLIQGSRKLLGPKDPWAYLNHEKLTKPSCLFNSEWSVVTTLTNSF